MTQQVLYHSTKYDGSVNYRWQAQLEYARDNLFILYTPPNTPYEGRRSGVLRYPFRSYFWTDRWFNINQIYEWERGAGVRHYVNLGMPATFDGITASYVDLDLDFDLDNDWGLTLLDEDEYAAHTVQFAYPSHVTHGVERAVQDVRQRVQARAWPFATAAESERLRLRPFFWSDLALIDQWSGRYSQFDDPWLIPAHDSYERHEWFSHYVDTSISRLYAIETCAGAMIGHISLREIALGGHARLGIGLAPTEVGKGYGTEALRTFLPYYFDVLGFERIVLDVAASNARAVRTYDKVGFKKIGEHYRGTGSESDWHILREPHYVKLRSFFRHSAWGLQQLHYDMELTREAWRAQRQQATGSRA